MIPLSQPTQHGLTDPLLSIFQLRKNKDNDPESVNKPLFLTKSSMENSKEAMEKFCKGKEHGKQFVNDGLESLFEDVRLGKEPDEVDRTYFSPKLSAKEIELVEKEDTSYLQTLSWPPNPDVPKAEMMFSESDSKYVDGWSYRRTFTIENSSSQSIFDCC